MKIRLQLLDVELEIEATPEEVLALTGAATGSAAIISLLSSLRKARQEQP